MNSIKRVLIFALVLAFSMGIFYKVSTYSTATVESNATLTITDSGGALISPRCIGPWEVMQGETVSDTIRVKNNMAHDIYIDVRFYPDKGGIKIHKTPYEEYVKSGETKSLCFEITVDPETDPGMVDVDVIFYAEWKNGEAEIETTVEMCITENPDLQLNPEQQPVDLTSEISEVIEVLQPEGLLNDTTERQEGESTQIVDSLESVVPGAGIETEPNYQREQDQDGNSQSQQTQDEQINDESKSELQDINEPGETESCNYSTDSEPSDSNSQPMETETAEEPSEVAPHQNETQTENGVLEINKGESKETETEKDDAESRLSEKETEDTTKKEGSIPIDGSDKEKAEAKTQKSDDHTLETPNATRRDNT